MSESTVDEVLVFGDDQGNFYGIALADLDQFQLGGEAQASVKEAVSDDVSGYNDTSVAATSGLSFLGSFAPLDGPFNRPKGAAAWTASGPRLRPLPRR